ncbi:WD repeat-containing protein 96 [Myotis brandtii]|uniref:Cilia- and flagella-associated protein 43 n=1 Tax=Myotis brandtii TaxID=109478 RepID=S7PW04_MYOBR|nr:WD repeat-containing protein 96 [Myotis brandtii]
MAQRREEGSISGASGAALSVRWVQGFPKQNVHFVNDSTICYSSGNFVIFINIETKKKTVLQCMNGIVGVVATNIPYEVVAFSDRKLKPLIYIYNFPGLTRRTKLKGNVLLDYTLLSFSYCGTYLASYSSLPEFELALWNWELGVILCKKSQPGVDVSQMTFNPMNWRQLCLSSPSLVTVWTIERTNQDHHLKAKSVKLPLEDGSYFNEKDIIFPESLPKDLIYGPILPLSAIAGLVGEEAETFRDGCVYSLIIKESNYKVEDFLQVEEHVGHMMFSPSYKMLLIQAGKGSVYIYTFGEEPTLDKVLEACDGKFQAIDLITPGNEHCMSTVLACSPSSFTAAVGTVNGSVYFIDILETASPEEIHMVHLSDSEIQHLLYDQRGLYLLAGTLQGYIFVINAKPSSSFQIFGYVEVIKGILQISTVSLLETDIVEVMVLSPLPATGRSRLEIFTLPKILPLVFANFADERGRMRDELIHKFLYEIEHSLSSAVLDFQSRIIYGFCNDVPYICCYCLPEKVYEEVKSSIHSSSQEELLQFVNKKEISWLERKSQEAIEKEVKLFSNKRKEIKRGIKELAKIVLKMMEENEAEDHIAKLEQREFGLDLDELDRLQKESEREVAEMRKDVDMHNLAKSYLAEIIKEECWNSMAVKGRALKCFHIPYVVENFPMKERTAEELKEVKRVLQQRKIETECLKLRKEIIEVQSAMTMVKKPRHEEEDEEEEEDVTDITYKVKTIFNKEFDTAYKQKEFEIARVKERNVRIQEIILDLELEETVWLPELDDSEKPERTLVVENSEITIQKHVPPWQRAKKELLAAQKMEQWLQSQANDTRHRALMDMMGGVLEVKKEDILRMVIPQPAFMAKPDAIWTEEERKQFKDYEKKVRELNEERDKYRKSLEAELRKLQNSIQESTQNFDEYLKRLFERRVKAEMVINQEELKINNLLFSLLLDEELSTRETFLNNYLIKKQEEKSQTIMAIQKAKDDLDLYKEHYDNLLAEDKVMDRSFKKEFSEIPSYQVDMLYKLFKRRPRIHKTKTHTEMASLVPFGERPGSGKLNKDAFAQLMKAMDDLDNTNNMPEGLDPSVWNHFCVTRRMKVENEQKVKQKAAGLVEMMAFLRKRVDEDEKVQEEIEKVSHELILLQEEKVKFQLNLTIQILLKQGQVELENFQLLLEYPDAILINKTIIEDLNAVIRTQGHKKVASMMESKDIHKGIFQIEWEHKKMEMEMEDLNQRAWDIQMLFFSRERQKYLSEPNYETLVAIQIGIMEQTIAVIDKTHKKNVENCKKLLKKLGKFSNQKDVTNYSLSCNLQEELVAVSERKDISNAMGSQLTFEKIAKVQYESMMEQQKLTNISKEQAEQILVLQAEVERLRMKTYPALIPM